MVTIVEQWMTPPHPSSQEKSNWPYPEPQIGSMGLLRSLFTDLVTGQLTQKSVGIKDYFCILLPSHILIGLLKRTQQSPKVKVLKKLLTNFSA